MSASPKDESLCSYEGSKIQQMNAENPQIVAKAPAACSDVEIADFVALVLAGGEVAPHGLENRVRSAERIAFLRENGCLLGVAGLKYPSQSHRSKVAELSGVPLPSKEFPFELGWVFIRPSARNRRLSVPLCRPLIEAAVSQGVFATSRTENDGMHRTLCKLGFIPAGAAYKSPRGSHQLQAFLRHSAQHCAPRDAAQ